MPIKKELTTKNEASPMYNIVVKITEFRLTLHPLIAFLILKTASKVISPAATRTLVSTAEGNYNSFPHPRIRTYGT